MIFSRQILSLEEPSPDRQTSATAVLGMHFDVEPDFRANVENTIYFASWDGLEQQDLRTRAVLTS